MLHVDSIDVVSLRTVWMLPVDVPALLAGLGKRGYNTARIRSKVEGGYEISPLLPSPPLFLAAKGSVEILYEPARRILIIEGSSGPDVLSAHADVESALREGGCIEPAQAILFYEVLVKAVASGSIGGKKVSLSDVIGTDMIAIQTRLVMENGNPNSVKWTDLDIRPIWTRWGKNAQYELIFIYRTGIEERDKIERIVGNADGVLKEIARKFSEVIT